MRQIEFKRNAKWCKGGLTKLIVLKKSKPIDQLKMSLFILWIWVGSCSKVNSCDNEAIMNENYHDVKAQNKDVAIYISPREETMELKKRWDSHNLIGFFKQDESAQMQRWHRWQVGAMYEDSQYRFLDVNVNWLLTVSYKRKSYVPFETLHYMSLVHTVWNYDVL